MYSFVERTIEGVRFVFFGAKPNEKYEKKIVNLICITIVSYILKDLYRVNDSVTSRVFIILLGCFSMLSHIILCNHMSFVRDKTETDY